MAFKNSLCNVVLVIHYGEICIQKYTEVFFADLFMQPEHLSCCRVYTVLFLVRQQPGEFGFNTKHGGYKLCRAHHFYDILCIVKVFVTVKNVLPK